MRSLVKSRVRQLLLLQLPSKSLSKLVSISCSCSCSCRPLSSGAGAGANNNNKSYALNYLDNWVGTKQPKDQNQNQASLAAAAAGNASSSSSSLSLSAPLHVTGSSYLLPTLRLPRSATAASLSEDLSSFFSVTGSNHAMKAMLQPKPHLTLPGKTPWRVPIILDMSTFQHDGSPHYRSPGEGFLSSIVSAFDDWGISVMGLTNVQTMENVGDEIVNMGLPVMNRVGSGRTLGKRLGGGSGAGAGAGAGAGNDSSSGNVVVGVEELVQLVLKQNHAEHSTSSMPPSSSNEATSIIYNEGTNTVIQEDENKEDMNMYRDDDDDDDDDYDDSHSDSDSDSVSLDYDTNFSKDDILNLPYRELQTTCRSLNLISGGNTETLQSRLIDYFGHRNALGFDERIGSDEQTQTQTQTQTHGNNRMNDHLLPNIQSIVPPKIYHGNVRSGQQVSTDEANQSLIILGNVSSGGEIMADCDIYVFGTLRGRAVAGLSQCQAESESESEDMNMNMNINDDDSNDDDDDDEDTSSNDDDDGDNGSKIVCSVFDAELICIGDTFTTIDSLEALGLKSGSGALITLSKNHGTNTDGDGDGDGVLNFNGF